MTNWYLILYIRRFRYTYTCLRINRYLNTFEINKRKSLTVCIQFSSVQSLSCVRLFATPWSTARQASLSIQLPESTQTHVHWVSHAIQPSHPFSFCLQSFPASESFQMSQLFALVAKVFQFQLQHQSYQWTPRADLLLDGLVRSPCSPRDSQESSPTRLFKIINSLVLSFLYSPTPQFKASILRCSAFFTVHISHPYMATGKTIALTRWIFVGK